MKRLSFPGSVSALNRVTCGMASFVLAFPLLMTAAAGAQTAARTTGQPEVRITAKVDNTKRTTLAGNTHPYTKTMPDLGSVDPSTPMQRMILSLTHSDAQETALGALMAQQQDKNSPLFHQWLTPQQFGAQFGASDADIATITAWLTGQGFTVNSISHGKSMIEFNGTAAQVTAAFQTPIHQFSLHGKVYQANTADPTIPAALTPVVRGVLSLYNFPRQMHHQSAGLFTRDLKTGKMTRLTAPSNKIQTVEEAKATATSSTPDLTYGSSYYTVAPYDFATIYNVLPLWNAGIDGTGQSIAVLEETDIHIDDVRAFRSIFGLPAKDPVIITNGPDPGVTNTDEEGEAVLDTEWSGAVAKGATIDFVTSASTLTTAGIDLSAIYAVDYNVAPITSLSYGYCEANSGATTNAFYVSLWQQGAAQGISHLVSTGDSGSDGCDDGTLYATSGIGVSGFASTPYNTAVGGTDFLGTVVGQLNGSIGTFWSPTNNATTQASALSYIPESTWNNNCTNPMYQTGLAGTTYDNYASASSACSSLGSNYTLGLLQTVGGSGGASTYSAKPSWQTGLGVPADGHRDIPDVSLLASNGSLPLINNSGQLGYYGSFYLVCQEDTNTNGQSCSASGLGSSIGGVGGTSVSTPAFAGILAMVNQKTNERQGLANYVLYDLYANQIAAGTACTSSYAYTGTGPITLGAPTMPAAGCVFNDITLGSNSAGCKKGGTDCIGTTTYGILGTSATGTEAYLNSTGYDLAVGLGSVNATNLVNSWSNITFLPTTTTLGLSSTSFAHGTSVNATVTVAPASGATASPTGLIQIDTTGAIKALGQATLASGTVTAAYTNFPGGTYTVDAYYTGDGTYASSSSTPIQITVTPESSTLTGKVQLENESTGALSTVSTCVYGAQCYLEFTPAGASGKGIPSGTITITNSGAAFATVPLTNGVTQIDTTGAIEGTGAGAFAPGTYSFSAQYSGDTSFGSSSIASPVALTISKSGSATTLTKPPTATQAAGAAVTLTATVVTSTSLANGDNFGAAPTGTVTFYSGGTSGTNLGTVAGTSVTYNANSDAPQGVFTLTTTGLPYSTTATLSDSVTAVYSGDSNYSTSTSAAGTVKVGASTKTATTSTLTATNTPLTYGTSTTLVDTLTYTSSNTPSGTVTFYVDGVVFGTAITLSSGTASVTIPALAGGPHALSATYAGDTNFVGSTGNLSTTVSPTSSDSLTLAGATASAAQGTQVQFVGTVGFSAPANPTGSITFSVDGAVASSIAALPFYTGGVGATFSTNALLPGSHTVTASYAGDKNYGPATASTSATLQIVAAPLLTLSTNQRSVIVLGAPVTINVVAQAISGGAIPTGSITYSVDGGAASSAITLSNGATSFAISGLSILKHTVIVTYSGDSTYTSVSQSIALNSDIAQSILFPGLAGTHYATAPTVSLAARSTSGLPVTYTVTGPATLSGSILTLTGTGTVSVTAAQAGNTSFAAATSVTRSFIVQ